MVACHELGIPCKILRPTIIYGKINQYEDRNLSLLIKCMRRFPFLPLPVHTGLRQPIHASQLAGVSLALLRRFSLGMHSYSNLSQCISLGGDSELSYLAMLRALQNALPVNDPARRCRFLILPTRCFQVFASPLILFSPKIFEALLRISSDLSGFKPAHAFLNDKPHPFPLLPLA